MRSRLSYTFLQKKERNIIHWVMRDIEVGDVEMLNSETHLLFLLFFVAK